MSRTFKILTSCLGILFLFFGCDYAIDHALYFRAKPPEGVKDFHSCLAWLKHADRNGYKITDGALVYYRVTGPAGRNFASGRAAYTFDAAGRFIGWTPDVGDLPTPGFHVSQTAKREKISLEEMNRNLP
jgi:hypothetical protein